MKCRLKFFLSFYSGSPTVPVSLLKRLFFLHWVTTAPLLKVSLAYLRWVYFWCLSPCPFHTVLTTVTTAAFSTSIKSLPSAQETSYLWELQIFVIHSIWRKMLTLCRALVLLRSFKGQLTFLNFDNQVSLLLAWQQWPRRWLKKCSNLWK